MNLTDVHQGIVRNKKGRRIGRGPGSGRGKTAGRGSKGAEARTGYSSKMIFEGGVMPLARRIPKRGFTNSFAPTVAVVNVGDLESHFDAGAEVTPDALKKTGLAKHPHDVVKILGTGALSKKLRVTAHQFSKSAQDKIQAAGGETVVIPGPKPVKNPKEDERQAKREAKKAKKGTSG